MQQYLIKKVAITGASGGVGVALVNKLISENVKVLVFQRKGSERTKNIPKSPLVEVVECNLDELSEYVSAENDYDAFFHLAWTNTSKTMRNSFQAQQENVAYSCDAVRLAYKLGCHTFVGAGSQAEYGRRKEPLREDTVCEPETAYGVMKLCACHSTRILCEEFGIRHIWPRILSGYGSYDNKNSMLISTILNSVNGKPLLFTKGEQLWDFVHLDDIANAYFLLAKSEKSKGIYPIGSGKERKLRNYIEILCERLGRLQEAEFGAIPYSAKEVMYLEADISKIHSDTGWVPAIDFEGGIEKTVKFYKACPER